MTTDRERFFSKVDRNGPIPAHRPELGPCHVWTACLSTDGYGKVSFRGKSERAHRVSFFFEHGHWPEPEGCHHCDNKRCVNGAHIFEGTRKDNCADMVSKRRQACGQVLPQTKLTEQDVRDIRANHALCSVTLRELAQRYGVRAHTIGRIVRGLRWKHEPFESAVRADLRQRGERNPKSKLTEQKVIDIRAEYARGGASTTELGARYGVSSTTIGRIVSKRSWKLMSEAPCPAR